MTIQTSLMPHFVEWYCARTIELRYSAISGAKGGRVFLLSSVKFLILVNSNLIMLCSTSKVYYIKLKSPVLSPGGREDALGAESGRDWTGHVREVQGGPKI